MPRASEISDAAAKWLIELEGRTRPEMWDRFQVWMDADPRHRAAFIRLRVAWNRTDVLNSLRPANGVVEPDLLAKSRLIATRSPAVAARHDGPPPGKRQHPELFSTRRRLLAAAGAIAAAGILAWLGFPRPGWSTHRTDVGSREQIVLADGTQVDLNTNTAMRVRITAGRRDIDLARGEALFHVAHDPARPFYVSAAGTIVRAVGTAFSVRIHGPGSTDVMVEEGKVAVGARTANTNFVNPVTPAAASAVSAGQMATVRGNSVSVHYVPAAELTRRLGWTSGHLVLQGESLEYAVDEFNRYHRRRIVIADPALREKQVGGSFDTWDQESFLAALQRSFGIRVERGEDGSDIRLFARRPGERR